MSHPSLMREFEDHRPFVNFLLTQYVSCVLRITQKGTLNRLLIYVFFVAWNLAAEFYLMIVSNTKFKNTQSYTRNSFWIFTLFYKKVSENAFIFPKEFCFFENFVLVPRQHNKLINLSLYRLTVKLDFYSLLFCLLIGAFTAIKIFEISSIKTIC